MQTIREVLDDRDFLEIETPFLTRSTPEGARDFLVPARVAPGSFYALPQSPQLFKQLLMVGGFERYYQIVRCFRDEDSRADRMTEFTQLDMEMAFVTEEDVYEVTEAVIGEVFRAPGARRRAAPVAAHDPRRGDVALRLGPPRHPLRPRAPRTWARSCRAPSFKVFADTLAGDGVVRGINAGRARACPLRARRADRAGQAARRQGSGVGLRPGRSAGLALPDRQVPERRGDRRRSTAGCRPRPAICCCSSPTRPPPPPRCSARCAWSWRRRFDLIEPGTHEILWVVQFPMFAFKPEEQRWDPEHHPFTAPATPAGEPATAADLGDPGSLLSRSYDLVLDGNEIGGGSIRNHRIDVQEKIFELIGIDEDEAQARFGFLLDALRFGAPPHGGIAFGLDRLVALLAGRDNIRETIAFPKATSGADPLTGAPAPVESGQLRELGLRLA